MTQEEQDRLICEMVKERNSLQRERTLLNEQVRRSKDGVRDASEVANLASQGNYDRGHSGFDYQDAEGFTATLQLLTMLARINVGMERLAEAWDREVAKARAAN